MKNPPTIISELKDLADTGVIRYNFSRHSLELKAAGDHQYFLLDVTELTDSLPEGSPSAPDIASIELELINYLSS